MVTEFDPVVIGEGIPMDAQSASLLVAWLHHREFSGISRFIALQDQPLYRAIANFSKYSHTPIAGHGVLSFYSSGDDGRDKSKAEEMLIPGYTLLEIATVLATDHGNKETSPVVHAIFAKTDQKTQ